MNQVWLALNNLIVDPRCRARYTYDDFRREVVLKLKRHMHEILFDQLPILKDLQRAVEEIALSVAPPSTEAKQGRLLLEQVPVVREALLRSDFPAIADKQRREVFRRGQGAMSKDRIKELMKTFEFMWWVRAVRPMCTRSRLARLLLTSPPPCSEVEPEKQEIKVEDDHVVYLWTKRRVGDGQWIIFEHLRMELDLEQPADPVEIKGQGVLGPMDAPDLPGSQAAKTCAGWIGRGCRRTRPAVAAQGDARGHSAVPSSGQDPGQAPGDGGRGPARAACARDQGHNRDGRGAMGHRRAARYGRVRTPGESSPPALPPTRPDPVCTCDPPCSFR